MKKESIYNTLKILVLLPLLMFFISCSPTRRLSEGEYLYNKSRFKFEDKRIDPELLKKYERISPNKRILGIRLHLSMYNLANPEKNKWPHNWLKKIGEAPVVYDTQLVAINLTNYAKYLSDIGYNNVQVSDSVNFKYHKKVNIVYYLNLGSPTIINSYKYFFEDTALAKYVLADTSNSLLRAGMPFNKQIMQTERLRIESLLKNNGYYKFSKEYIYYDVKRSMQPGKVEITLNIKQNLTGYIDPVTMIKPHKKYIVNSVLLFPDIQKIDKSKVYDTLNYSNYQFLYPGAAMINPSTLANACRIEPGKEYALNNVDKTYTNLSALGLFRFINVNFSEIVTDEATNKLNCQIELAMRKRQSYAVELVVTNSTSDLGVRGNITYHNYNFFRGGEHFQFGISGAYESLQHRLGPGEKPMKELGFNTRLETPKFLLPFSASEFQKKYSPRTVLQLSYNNQRQPAYIRTIASSSFGYTWKGNSYNRHTIYPVDFSLVKLPNGIDSGYYAKYIEGTRQVNSFVNHTILALRYGFEFNTQSKGYNSNFIYLRTNIESAGLMVNTVNKFTNWGYDSLFFGVQFFQYLRTDIDFRHFNVTSPGTRVVYRVYGGIGLPYGNSVAMPFERMFGAGGPYGIRAWKELTLGPGTTPDSLNSLNQLGDIKLEGNVEYRFKLFWIIEGALFVDAGNIWLLNENSKNPGGVFHLNSFYKDIAIGAGFGTRFDLSFVLIRTDFGLKLRDPSIPGENKWTNKNGFNEINDIVFQFGIGYPF